MKELFDKLENSEEYKKFKEEYPDSYFCTAFFVLGNPEETKKQLNYAISDTEVMSFDLSGDKIIPMKMKTVGAEKQHHLNKDEIQIGPEQAAQNVKNHSNKKFNKIIAVLQDLNGEIMWNITCMDGFQISRFHVSAKDGKIQDLKGINIRDMMKVEKKNPATGKTEQVEIKEPKEEAPVVRTNTAPIAPKPVEEPVEEKPKEAPAEQTPSEAPQQEPVEETPKEKAPDYVQ